MTEDNELIEQMAQAILFPTGDRLMRRSKWMLEHADVRARKRVEARAALTAYRNHEVEL